MKNKSQNFINSLYIFLQLNTVKAADGIIIIPTTPIPYDGGFKNMLANYFLRLVTFVDSLKHKKIEMILLSLFSLLFILLVIIYVLIKIAFQIKKVTAKKSHKVTV